MNESSLPCAVLLRERLAAVRERERLRAGNWAPDSASDSVAWNSHATLGMNLPLSGAWFAYLPHEEN